jgi:hypothetical protein
MRKIASSLVYPVSSPPLRNAIVEIDDDGVIMAVDPGGQSFREKAGVEFYSGILLPGLADVMCGDRGSHWLLGRGIRVSGRIGAAATGTLPGDASARSSWKSLYGGEVDYRVFRDMEHFMRGFTPGDFNGIYHALGRGGSLPVLASFGRMELVELMFLLQEGPGKFSLPFLLSMATINGAVAMDCDGLTGSLSPGKRPGLNIIEGADINNMRLLPGSRLRRLQ